MSSLAKIWWAKRRKAHIFYGVVLLSIFCCTTGFAQLNTTVFQDFNKTIFNPYLINPAATDTGYTFNARFNNISELGVFRNLSRFYLDAERKIKSKTTNGSHFVGVQLSNTKQGDFINRSRLQARYSWMLQLSRKAALASGISLGFVNYAFLTSQGGSGGSDTGPDGAVGVHYIRKNFVFGLAIQQIFNSVIIPVDQSFQISRQYNVDLLKRFQLSFDVSMEAQAVLQVPEELDFARYSMTLLGRYKETALIGVGNYNLEKTSFNAGVENITFLKARLSLVFTYVIYHSPIMLGDNSFEIFIGLKK